MSNLNKSKAVQISWIEVYNFRLLRPQKVEFNNRITVISGLNGQGKTSFLEAIYFLSQAKSFRTARSKEVIRWNSDYRGVNVTGKIDTEVGSKKISYKLINGKKSIEINDKAINKPIDFFGQFRVVDISPSDAELVFGSSPVRRKFMDRLLAMSKPSYIDILFDYQRALKNRNSLFIKTKSPLFLKERETLFKNVSIWNDVLIELGLKLFESRQSFILTFEPYLINRYREIAGSKTNEKVSLGYRSKFLNKENGLLIENLKEDFIKYFDQDIRQKTTTFGVHRDDMQIFLDTSFGPKEAKQSASQGQTKNIALALKLAANDYLSTSDNMNELPVLLLDDIESELDENRRRDLFNLLSTIKNQVIIATTGLSDAAKQSLENPSFFIVKNGQIIPQN